MGKDLFLCDLLVHNINLMRDCNERLQVKADISDGLCAIDMAIDEVSTERVKEMLHTAKDLISNYHFLVDLMAIDKPKNCRFIKEVQYDFSGFNQWLVEQDTPEGIIARVKRIMINYARTTDEDMLESMKEDLSYLDFFGERISYH